MEVRDEFLKKIYCEFVIEGIWSSLPFWGVSLSNSVARLRIIMYQKAIVRATKNSQ